VFSKKYIAPLACGFGAAVLSVIPGLKALACCLIVPLAAILSLVLDQKINNIIENISSKKAIIFGVLTGIYSAIFASGFEIMITYVAKTNDFVESIPATEALLRDYDLGPLLDHSMGIINKMAEDIKTNGFSLLYSLMILFSNLLINTIFGLLGGLLGMVFLNRKRS
jgi:hypothetical protein